MSSLCWQNVYFGAQYGAFPRTNTPKEITGFFGGGGGQDSLAGPAGTQPSDIFPLAWLGLQKI